MLVQDFSNQLLRTAGFTWSNITASGSLAVGYWYEGTRYVGPDNYTSLTDAVAAAQAGDTIIVSNGNYGEVVTISSNLTLVGTNLTGVTAITVQTGVVVTVSGFTNLSVSGLVQVGTNGTLVISNSVVNFDALSIQSGALVRVVNGTVTANGVTVMGNFVLNYNWGGTLVAMPINFADSFEAYPPGSLLRSLSSFGWSASRSNVVVEVPAVRAPGSTNAVLVPAGEWVSNLVAGAGAGLTNIWTDFYLMETQYMTSVDASVTNGGPAVAAYLGTNGYLTVFNRDVVGGWDVCSNDVMGNASPRGTGGWTRVSWFLDYGVGVKRAAFFIDGHLVRQQVPFVSPLASYSSLRLDSGVAGQAHLDSVSISTTVPAGLSHDGDGDGIADAVEILQYGTTVLWPRGSVFKLR